MFKIKFRHMQLINQNVKCLFRLLPHRKAKVCHSYSTIFKSTRRPSSFVKRLSSTTKSSDEVELEHEIEDSEIIESTSKKFLLYSDPEPTIIKLNECKDINEIFTKLEEYDALLTHQHIVQSILLIWDLVKSDEKASIDLFGDSRFSQLLDRVVERSRDMTPEEITCCLLYLNKIGLSIKEDHMQEIIQQCLVLINDRDAPFTLEALSRFTVALSAVQGDLYQYLVCKDVIPRVLDYLDRCHTSEDLRLITICLNYLYRLVTPDIMKNFERKVDELMKNGSINSETVRCILKLVNFLNHPQWSQENIQLIRTLSLLLKDNISKFQTKELVSVFKVFQSHLEPAILMPAIISQSQQLLSSNPSAELLACAVFYSLPEKRSKMTEIAKEIVYNSEITNASTLPALFKALRLLKISNLILVNAYWKKVIAEIESNPEERESYRIARQCHRYMHFNNNLGGTYRHREFERLISSFVLEELQSGLSRFIPMKFAKFASFIIAYGDGSERNTIPEFIVEKLEVMGGQLSIFDCLQISRGMQIALEMRFRHYLSKEVATQVARIENLLNACAERHLETKELSLLELNTIVRSFNNRKSSRKTYLFQRLIGKYKEIDEPLNSRLIREITFNLNASGYRIDTVCDKLLDYVNENKEFVIGDTAEKVLFCCYNLGYTPANMDALQSCVELIHRDFESMSGLAIVQACLALSFFKHLPTDLISRVFNIDFIQRLEDEIKMCYSKATYPERVLNQVMQLNRSVCLDFPEAQVPWFQQNYIEAQMTKQPKIETKFQQDVKRMLIAVVPDSKSITTDLITPYGYRIDFVVYLDKDKHFILPPPDDTHSSLVNILRIAILLPKYESYCENSNNKMRGAEYLKQRHLEMLGYKVVHVNFNDWNSMYMNVPNAKIDYIKGLLKIE